MSFQFFHILVNTYYFPFLFLCFVFAKTAVLLGVKWYPVVVLISISLMTYDMEHYLPSVYFLGEVSVKVFGPSGCFLIVEF